jgi:D-cysteine desulfhydrase
VPEIESSVQPLRIGRYPTPVSRLDAFCGDRTELWLKNDGVSAEPYGGNKVRKLELILAEAARRGARRIVTTGAGGSHHVLSTALYAQRIGIPVVAVLCPQPFSEHAERTLRASLGAGVEPVLARSMTTVPFAVARVLRRGDYFVPAGGSSTLGTLGYLHAVRELLDQIRAGELPEPDLIIAALGSGGTVAGLLAGVVREGLRARVVGVNVAVVSPLAQALVLALAHAAIRADAGQAGVVRLARRLEVDPSERGGGYGHRTDGGDRATHDAAGAGLTLDPTYTAKTFARALREVRGTGTGPKRVVLYWHTLNAAPLEPLLALAPAMLPRELRMLLPEPTADRR